MIRNRQIGINDEIQDAHVYIGCIRFSRFLPFGWLRYRKIDSFEREKQTVATANQIISEEYGISFDANDYSYSVGEKTSEGDYVPLGDAKEDSRSAGRIISVSALKKNAPEENEMHSYSLEYSLRSNQILHVSVKFG